MQDERAVSCRTVLAGDAYVFARDPEGREPWRPDSSATGRFMALRDRLDLRHVRLHDLRHYVATRLLDAGVPVRSVSERLGHASATTTLTIYAAAVPATDRLAADILGGLLDDPGLTVDTCPRCRCKVSTRCLTGTRTRRSTQPSPTRGRTVGP